MSSQGAPTGIDTTKPHPARVYDYLLGGKDNYPPDWEAAQAILRIAPEARAVAQANRAFMRRAVRFLVGEAGIRQIIDIGTGIPTAPNVHEIAHQLNRDVRVAYVDKDPIVYAHANALLTGSGATCAVLADLREPEAILKHPKLRALIDLGQPVALLLIAVLHFIRADENPTEFIAAFRNALPRRSFLVISHATSDFRAEEVAQVAEVYNRATSPAIPRSRSQIEHFFDDTEMVDPGLVQVPLSLSA